jgi:hypothetical protein
MTYHTRALLMFLMMYDDDMRFSSLRRDEKSFMALHRRKLRYQRHPTFLVPQGVLVGCYWWLKNGCWCLFDASDDAWWWSVVFIPQEGWKVVYGPQEAQTTLPTASNLPYTSRGISWMLLMIKWWLLVPIQC